MMRPAFFAGRKNRFGVRSFQVDAGITGGNSGGPVLNSDDEVVGVAVTGGQSLPEGKAAIEYGVISIDEIDRLTKK